MGTEDIVFGANSQAAIMERQRIADAEAALAATPPSVEEVIEASANADKVADDNTAKVLEEVSTAVGNAKGKPAAVGAKL